MEVLNEGEYVNDLFIVVSGEMEKYSSTLPFMTEDIQLLGEHTSVHGGGLLGSSHVLGEGDVLGEIAFITGTAQLEVGKERGGGDGGLVCVTWVMCCWECGWA